MKAIAHNGRQLDNILSDICRMFEEKKELRIEYDVPFKEKTKNQRGFFFGAIGSSIQEFFEEKKEPRDKEEITENFYKAIPLIDDSFLKKMRRFDGSEYLASKRISKMSVEEMSLFINRALFLIDNSKAFEGFYLHPSIRYTWVKHLTREDILGLKSLNLPDRDPEYLASVRKEPCIWCGKANCSEAHHLKMAGVTGTSLKAPDWMAIPLCSECHRAELHQHGEDAFLNDLKWLTKDIELLDFCKIKYNRWKNHL